MGMPSCRASSGETHRNPQAQVHHAHLRRGCITARRTCAAGNAGCRIFIRWFARADYISPVGISRGPERSRVYRGGGKAEVRLRGRMTRVGYSAQFRRIKKAPATSGLLTPAIPKSAASHVAVARSVSALFRMSICFSPFQKVNLIGYDARSKAWGTSWPQQRSSHCRKRRSPKRRNENPRSRHLGQVAFRT